MEKEEPRQLKLVNRTGDEGKEDVSTGKRGKKEKQEKANKWILVVILLVSVIMSLIFYFSSNAPRRETVPTENNSQDNSIFAPKVYQF